MRFALHFLKNKQKGIKMNKTKPIQVRVSENERAAFKDAAKIMGVSLSAWIRLNLRKAANRDHEAVGQQITFLKNGEILNEKT